MRNIKLWIMIVAAATAMPTWGALTQPLYPDSATGAELTGGGGVLDSLYGLENLVRIDDGNANVTDQFWRYADSGSVGEATARAKYAGFEHEFGILAGFSGNEFDALINSGDSYYGVYNGNSSKRRGEFSSSQTGDVFRLGLDIINHEGYRWSSAEQDNLVMPGGAAGDGIDHMITFEIIGNASGFKKNQIGNFVVCWEDLSSTGSLGGFDGDYGDLVVELSGIVPYMNSSIPEPATVSVLVLGGLIMMARRRIHT